MSDWRPTILPRGAEDSPAVDPALRTAFWLPSDTVADALGHDGDNPAGVSPIVLGAASKASRSKLVAFDDDRHMVTIAGSRSGKGVSLLIPNLLSYRGSVVVTDPKGELAAITAAYRRDVLGQKIVVLDPFLVLKGMGVKGITVGRYNPLQWLNQKDREFIDDVGQIAEAIVVKDKDETHFYETALSYIKAVILFLATDMPYPKFDLIEIRKLVMMGVDDQGIDDLVNLLATSKSCDGVIARIAAMIDQMGDRERGSVLSTVGRNTAFLDGDPMASCLTGTSSFDPRTLKTKPTTVYLVLPEWRMASHFRWLRLMIASILSALQRAPMSPKETPACLLLLDEFAALGHMESIERAAGYIAGFGVKLWTVLQDLSQLKGLYPNRWETFLGNAGLITAFGNADAMTTDYLSKRCGQTEVLKIEANVTQTGGSSVNRAGFGAQLHALLKGEDAFKLGTQSRQDSSSYSSQSAPKLVPTPLITPDEITVNFARETGSMMVLINGARPIRLTRLRYYDDPRYKDRAAPSPYHRT